MGVMSQDDILGGTLLSVFLLLVLLVVWGLRRTFSTSRQLARLSQLESDLAVAQSKLTRIPELQAELDAYRRNYEQARDAQSTAEANLARTGAELRHIADSFENVRSRLKQFEDAKLEERLAARNTALAHAESIAEQLTDRLAGTEHDLRTAEAARQTLATAQATLRETLTQERTQAEEKLRLLTEAKAQMSREFQHLAAAVTEQHGETFKRQNKEQIDALLSPLREKLGEFQTGLQTAHKESAAERATLGEQIRQVLQQGDRMTAETTNLTRALKGKSQTQGAWGKMILVSILERSGLIKDLHYFVQESVENDEGRRLRPDAKVKLPGAPHLVIDAKVSLVAFEAHVNAETEEDRATQLDNHLRSLRTHIATLASKDYHAATGSEVDYVIMFVPIEGALSAALSHDPELTGHAIESGVTIATPTTLMIALRTVANVWRIDNRNKNAELIAAEAGRLYDKFVGFVDDMKGLGARLTQAQSTYDTAMHKLSNGQGNLMARAEHLKRRGAKTAKSLPFSALTTDEVALLAAEDKETTSLEETGVETAAN